MAHDDVPLDWPAPLRDYWIPDAEILKARAEDAERPGRDSLGNAGHVRRICHSGKIALRWPRVRIVRRFEKLGFTVERDARGEAELRLERRDTDPMGEDPLLLEDRVVVVVTGREFPGQQRAVLEAKAEALRKELEEGTLAPDRREEIVGMLRAMDDGLRSTVEMRSVVRRFRPSVSVKRTLDEMGTVLPLKTGSRFVYSVRSNAQDEAEDDDAPEPMIFHVLALGESEAALLFTGGVHGMRHLRDLETSRVHHAWFANRERAKTDATAPWLGRGAFRALLETGESAVVIHPRRDAEPARLEKVGEETTVVRVDGEPRDVPVVRCRTEHDDVLLVLNDPESPLVLRLEESGVELIRTIDDVLSPRAVEESQSEPVAAGAAATGPVSDGATMTMAD